MRKSLPYRLLAPYQQPPLVLVSGGTHPEFATTIAETLDVPLAPTINEVYPDSEVRFRFSRTRNAGEGLKSAVRGADVYAIAAIDAHTTQTDRPHWTSNDALMELMIMADAAKTNGAYRFTAVIPAYPYAQEDEQTDGESMFEKSAAAALVGRLLVQSGVDAAVSMDIHSPQSQGFLPNFELIESQAALLRGAEEWLAGKDRREVTVAALRSGGMKTVKSFAHALGVPLALVDIDKKGELIETSKGQFSETGTIQGRHVLFVDDLIKTGNVVLSGIRRAEERGVKSVAVAVTHNSMTPEVAREIEATSVEQLIVTNTISQAVNKAIMKKLRVVDVADDFARKINYMYTGEDRPDDLLQPEPVKKD